MDEEPAKATLTIRVDPSLHRSLAAVAEAEGSSMNAVAEAALNREVAERGAELAETYEHAAEVMRGDVHCLADVIDEIAADETAMGEPVPTRHTVAPLAAAFGAISARARRVR
jgi:predicted transcriptional regulator